MGKKKEIKTQNDNKVMAMALSHTNSCRYSSDYSPEATFWPQKKQKNHIKEKFFS